MEHRKIKRKFQTTGPSAEPPKKPRKFHLHKRNFAFIAVAVILALTMPLVFATAANTNEVAKIEEINMEEEASQTPQPTEESPATTDGEIVSDVTESAPEPEPTVQPTPEPTPTPEPEPAYTVLSPGVTDPFVKMIQQRLMDLDYMGQDEPTDLYGPITTQAMEYFQRKNGLPVDGIAGVETQQLLFSDNAKHYTVSEGASGPDVESIQQRLAELGYAVSADGSFGPSTTAAVKYFQRMNGLAEDGNVGSSTREALYSQDAEPSAEYWEDSSEDDSEDEDNEDEADESADSGSEDAGSTDESSDDGGSEDADSGEDSSDDGGSPPVSDTGGAEAFVNAALAQLGKTYVLGGKGPDAFDCSGLVYYALSASGNGVSYMTSYGWANAGQYACIGSMGDLQRGDIVCENGHVGIYLGGGEVVHASSSNGKVVVSGIGSSYWSSNWICGRRIF